LIVIHLELPPWSIIVYSPEYTNILKSIQTGMKNSTPFQIIIEGEDSSGETHHPVDIRNHLIDPYKLLKGDY
jgi:hypothetical protein